MIVRQSNGMYLGIPEARGKHPDLSDFQSPRPPAPPAAPAVRIPGERFGPQPHPKGELPLYFW